MAAKNDVPDEETPYHSLTDVEEDAPVRQALEVHHDHELRHSDTTVSNYNSSSVPHNIVPSSWDRTFCITAMWMSMAAILGAFLRIVLAQLFGEECANPGTVGWLAASSPLCVTKTGESTLEGGIVFADLPSNLLGSFSMGMMQTGAALELPVDIPIAWLSPKSNFQHWGILHLAIRTGFCGSLTTFSSWNSEMVVLMFGTGTRNLHSDVWRAIFGYIIGMETALGSFVLGQRVASWIHRARNRDLAEEMDAIYDRKQEGVHINPKLPELERRFLPDLRMDVPNVDALEYLERWRESTYDARRNGHGLLTHLLDMEETTLIQGSSLLSSDQMAIANKAGWDVDALLEWIRSHPRDAQDHTPQNVQHPVFLSLEVTSAIFLAVVTLILVGLVLINDPSAYSVTYRTMFYATTLAPFGALLRWHLSGWNGNLKSAMWHWLPVGTLSANVLGSVISIAMVAAELEMASGNGFWGVGTVRAIKVGFCGCLTTVSTFVSEVSKFMKVSPQQYRAYIYILVSLGVSSILSTLVFGIIIACAKRFW